MKKAFTKNDEEFRIFNEFWKITQEYYEPEPSDEYWEGFKKAIEDFEKNHKGNLLCEQMILMLMEYLEKKFRINHPSKYTNVAAYIKLLRQVRFAYSDFQKNADEKDKALLKEVMDDNQNAEEEKILRAVMNAAK